jgi:hypothetical protein
MPTEIARHFYIQPGHRLMVVLGERTKRLQDIELRNLAADTAHAIAKPRGHARNRFEHHRTHPEMRSVLI